EIVVTAQKREQRLEDVPVPVSAVNAQALAETSQASMADWYMQVPGLNIRPTIQSAQNIAIRGLTTGSLDPTVGVTIDDVPIGQYGGGGGLIGDVDPS